MSNILAAGFPMFCIAYVIWVVITEPLVALIGLVLFAAILLATIKYKIIKGEY